MANYSNALKRVLAYGKRRIFGLSFGRSKMIGIYMSKMQIEKLSTYLLEHEDGPDGIWFMIGEENSTNSVELIPYKKRDTENPMKFFIDKKGIIGGININIGGRNPDSIFDFTITGDGIVGVRFPSDPNVPRVLEFGELVTNPNQRTPPPISA